MQRGILGCLCPKNSPELQIIESTDRQLNKWNKFDSKTNLSKKFLNIQQNWANEGLAIYEVNVVSFGFHWTVLSIILTEVRKN